MLLKDKYGMPLSLQKEETDTHCYTCTEIESNKEAMMENIKYNHQYFQLITYMDGSVAMYNEHCSKEKKQFLDRWGDSVSVVMWHTLRQETGLLIFYIAEESNTYPYYKPDKIDSVLYNLKEFCSEKEMEEDKKSMQAMFERVMQIQITPNPFKESFELTMHAGKVKMFLYNAQFLLSFFDDSGTPLSSQPIELDKAYHFSFPTIPSGKTIYYRITWDDYLLSGQVKKS